MYQGAFVPFLCDYWIFLHILPASSATQGFVLGPQFLSTSVETFSGVLTSLLKPKHTENIQFFE